MPNPVTSTDSVVSIVVTIKSENELTRIPSLGDCKPLGPTAGVTAVCDVVEHLGVGVLGKKSALKNCDIKSNFSLGNSPVLGSQNQWFSFLLQSFPR